MPVLLDDIVTNYQTVKSYDLQKLPDVMGYKPVIWTFANDCACCT